MTCEPDQSTRLVELPETDADEIASVIDRQRQAFLREGPPPLEVRRHRMDRLAAMTFENAPELADAIGRDFGSRPSSTSLLCEVLAVIGDTEHIRHNVKAWMRPRRVATLMRPLGMRTAVHSQPLGVVGVMGAWNFPLVLLIQPTMAAFAAGNRVVMKTSEIVPLTSLLVQRLVSEYFPIEELAVFTGGVRTAEAFASSKLDHLFFTGSSTIGRRVQRAAADNLVPVTLELGGKNPAVVAPDADVARAAQRIARARMINGGQVCLSPDFVLAPRESVPAFVAAARAELQRLYPRVLDNSDYCSIVDDKNFHRILGLIEDAKSKGALVVDAAPSGEALPSLSQRRIAPTLVHNVADHMDVMHEEVFGPVLSVVGYDDTDEIIHYLNQRPSPLASYWYGGDTPAFRRFCRVTSSGGVTRNDFALHAAVNGVPFGGVGQSGIGSYHGKAGFETFSHQRTVTQSILPFSATALMLSPPPQWLAKTMSIAMRWQTRRLRRRIAGFARRSAANLPPLRQTRGDPSP